MLDTYQLKSLDAVLESPVEEVVVRKDRHNKLKVAMHKDAEWKFDNFALRDSYDRVIRCLGWQFDDSLMNK